VTPAAPVNYHGLDWLATALGLASIYCLSRGRKVGFLLRIFASVCWAAFGVLAGTPAAVVANLLAIVFCLRGLGQEPVFLDPPARRR
jgi:hypothetical protein